ncbi:MAG: N-6 DNA methylase [Spirochaetes bacterium]|nr:N-6 DNA methylase [Spirochaetota bacterium]
MPSPLHDYIAALDTLYREGKATEHSYRPALKKLIEALDNTVAATNEPKREKCGSPDYIVTRKQIPVGYIEAKDVGIDLNKVEKGSDRDDQLERYLDQLENLILTDYLEFRFFRYGKKVHTVVLASVEKGNVMLKGDGSEVEQAIREFLAFRGQTIKSAEQLAKMMAHKAQLMRNVIYRALVSEDKTEKSPLREQLEAFQKILIHDMDEKQFADMYSQTIAYGLFAARLHDDTLEDFSRQEARDLVPKSNPFLRTLFDHILGANVDERIIWIVDALIDVFRACDIRALIDSFGKTKNAVHTDPMIHFYETFLSEYDPNLRKSRGVYYTPEPVVDFIVRAVDDILISEFDLPQGLADTSKVTVEVPVQGSKGTQKKSVHRVQILDPATGTGTFLARIVEQIHSKFKGQEGIWSSYVEEHLKPRVNGFEILMAPYAMCHLKLDILLQKTGYKPTGKNGRFHVYLTNALEEAHPDTGTLWISELSKEASAANEVKRDTPVMVVLGNPPYSGHSSNKGEWIQKLLEDYKQEPGGGKLQERNPKWLNDDYVKFIRYGEHFVEKNGAGILAFINNHSFLDNPTFRGMRWQLLNTFDKILVLDLHGNAKKKETAPDGSADENVFDIQQGVSINLFVKTGKNRKGHLGKISQVDLFGDREAKYEKLSRKNIKSIGFKNIESIAPNYFFIVKDNHSRNFFEDGIAASDLFNLNSMGIATARDELTIKMQKSEIADIIKKFPYLPPEDARREYNLAKDAEDWKIALAQQDLIDSGVVQTNILSVSYRPFDVRWTYFTGRSKGFHCRPRGEVMRNFIHARNIGLCLVKVSRAVEVHNFFLTQHITDKSITSSLDNANIFPLYLYPAPKADDMFDPHPPDPSIGVAEGRGEGATPNLNMEIVSQLAEKIKLTFEDDGASAALSDRRKRPTKTFAPIDLLDYIYGVLHSPNYREKYKEFLKIDFPRVPYPESAKEFWAFAQFGGELRTLHLMESPKLAKPITKFSISGSNEVEKISFEPTTKGRGKVFINKDQYFDGVPEVAWSFYIGGYQPAQKWLKDRKGRTLTSDDAMHYQKIIVALTETARVMGEIEKVKRF